VPWRSETRGQKLDGRLPLKTQLESGSPAPGGRPQYRSSGRPKLYLMRVLRSYFHTPSEMTRASLLTVLRAGHLKASSDYRVDRRICAGHDILLCLRGLGCVQMRGMDFPVRRGEVAWIDGAHPHAHWADRDNPWELLWLRIDGKSLAPIAEALGVSKAPVFGHTSSSTEAAKIIRRILQLLENRPPALDATLNAEVAALVAWCFRVRESEASAAAMGEKDSTPALRRVLDQLTIYYYRSWRMGELADLAGCSVPHLYRIFQRTTRMSPRKWLRRERMYHAQSRLLETGDLVKEIAEQVGYDDALYFSRDFKRFAGVSPREFRRREKPTLHVFR